MMNESKPTYSDLMQVELDKINTKVDLVSRQAQTTQLDIQESTNKLVTIINAATKEKDDIIKENDNIIKLLRQTVDNLHAELAELKDKEPQPAE